MTDQPDAPARPEDSPAAADRPKLARGRDDRKVLAGVCSGAGRYFDVDPVIFRVVLVVLSLTGGIGLIIYGMGWLVVPQDGERQSEAHRLLSGRVEGTSLTAVLMALVGCGLYASTIGNGVNQAFSILLLIATAGAVYWSQQRGRALEAGEPVSPAAAGVVADAPPAVQAPPEPGSPSWWREPLAKAPSYLWGPDDGPYGKEDKAVWRERKKAARQERGGWLFGCTVFLLALTAAATGVGVSWAEQPFGTSLEIGLAAALGVFGGAFLLASFAGRARGGTVFLSLLTIAGLIAAAALPRTGHGLGGITWRPLTATGVPALYERGTGTSTLDLTRLALDGGTVTTELKLGAGQAVVRLPRNATVTLDYDLGFGKVKLPGKADDGVDLKSGQHKQVVYAPPPGTPSAGVINLGVNVGVGELRVIR